MSCTEHDYEFITESPTSMAKRFDTISSDREVTVVEVNTKRSHKCRPVSIDDEEEVEVLVATTQEEKAESEWEASKCEADKESKVKNRCISR